MKLQGIFVLAVFLIIGSVIPGRAAGLDEIAKDFKPLSGYIIMPVNDEYLIDQDAAKGVAVGDLFAVVTKGEKIIHPVTKEVLGTLDQVKGVLQVTRVKSGYSYARPLGKVEGLKAGDVIRRYENIPAIFWDYTGQGSGLFAQLKDALPNLDWKDYAAAQAERPATPGALAKGGPALLFVLNGSGLQVHDADFRILHAYPPSEFTATAAVPSPRPPAAPIAVAPVPSPTPMPGPVSHGPLKWEQGPVAGGTGATGYQAVYPGFETVGPLPDGYPHGGLCPGRRSAAPGHHRWQVHPGLYRRRRVGAPGPGPSIPTRADTCPALVAAGGTRAPLPGGDLFR